MLESVQRPLDELSERRVDLWHKLSEGHDTALKAEVHAVEERLEELWQEQRQLRAQLRWGDRQKIIARARAEERLERHAASAGRHCGRRLEVRRGVSSRGPCPERLVRRAAVAPTVSFRTGSRTRS